MSSGGPRFAIGVDIGGTLTAAGLVAEDGRVVVHEQTPTHASGAGSAEAAIGVLVERVMTADAAAGLTIAGIGAGVPALVDPVAGTVGPEVPHVPELAGRPLAQILSKRFGLPSFIDNDVNAISLAEWSFGAGAELERAGVGGPRGRAGAVRGRAGAARGGAGAGSLVVLAAGTGFGSGIVLEGRLVRGARSLGAEFGHAPVKFDGRPCWCGGRGCLAVYASGRGVAEAARTLVAGRPESELLRAAGGDPMQITAAAVFGAADRGDPIAATVVDEACRALGAMIGTIVNGLNPDVIVVTGGVAAAYAKLERRVLEAAADHAFARALAGTRVVIVPGDKRVTMRGAAALVFYELDAAAGRPA